MQKYVNRVDRGMFFYFYDDAEFQEIEKRTTTLLATTNHQFLYSSQVAVKEVLDKVGEQVGEDCREVVEGLFL